MVFREGRRSLNKNITGDLNRSKNSTEVEVSSKSVLEINKTVKNKKYCFHTKLDSMTQRAKRILKGCLALSQGGGGRGFFLDKKTLYKRLRKIQKIYFDHPSTCSGKKKKNGRIF